MYARLAVGNVRRSLRDFSVFFLTLVFGVAAFYAFGTVQAQTAVLDLAADQREQVVSLLGVLDGVSVFVALVLGFLVVYANRFLVRRRKREFGIYLTLGMDQLHVGLVMVLESLVVGVAALLVGLLVGFAASQVMTYVTASLFECTVTGFSPVFSADSAVRTVACFALVFAASLVVDVVTVSRCSLAELLSAERTSEEVKVRSLPLCAALCVVALAMIAMAYAVLLRHGILSEGPWFSIATALVSVGTLLLFFSASGFLLRLAQSCRGLYLRGVNMFVLRQLNSRVNTAWLSVSVVCAMLFLAVCGVCTGLSVSHGLNESLRAGTPFDATIVSMPDGDLEDAMRRGSSDVPAAAYGYDMQAALSHDVEGWDQMVRSAVQVDAFDVAPRDGGVTVGQLLDAVDADLDATTRQAVEGSNDSDLLLVPESQVDALLEQRGERPVDLGPDGFAFLCDIDSLAPFFSAFARQVGTLELAGHELRARTDLPGSSDGVLDLKIANGPMGSVAGAVVVPDEVVPASAVRAQSFLDVMYAGSREDVNQRFLDALGAAYGPGDYDDPAQCWPVLNVVDAQGLLGEQGGVTVTFTYLAIYLGFVLLVACAAVLALQQLSGASDDASRYRVLGELGAEPRELRRALSAQVGVYFLLPLVVAVAHAAVALASVNEVVELMTGVQVASSLLPTAVFLVVLYGGYYLVTVRTARSMLERGVESRRSGR